MYSHILRGCRGYRRLLAAGRGGLLWPMAVPFFYHFLPSLYLLNLTGWGQAVSDGLNRPCGLTAALFHFNLGLFMGIFSPLLSLSVATFFLIKEVYGV